MQHKIREDLLPELVIYIFYNNHYTKYVDQVQV